MDMQQRIVITGIGAVTSIGTGGQQFWDNVLAGRCGISPVESFDTKDYNVHRGGEVKGFCPGDHVLSLDPDRLGRTSQFSIAAARMALVDADEDLSDRDPERVGVSIGTTLGESFEIQQAMPHFIHGELEKIGPDFMSNLPLPRSRGARRQRIAGFGYQHGDPRRVRRRQLCHRSRFRRIEVGASRLDAGGRGRIFFTPCVHRICQARRARAGCLPAVRPQPQRDDPGRRRGHDGFRAARERRQAGRAHLRRSHRLWSVL